MEQPPWSLGFMSLPFVVLKSSASFVLCTHGINLETEWMFETNKIDDEIQVWTTKGWR